MSVDATRWVWQQRQVTPAQKLVLLSMADRAGEEHRCWPSNARLCADTCLDRKTVYGCIEKLEEMGLIRTIRQTGRQNVYELVGVHGREDATPRPSNAPVTSIATHAATSAESGASPEIATSPDSGTSPEITTSPKSGTEPVPKTDFDQSQKRDTNLKENLKRTGKSAHANFSTPKIPHGENGLVLLTEAEHARLTARYGREWTDEAINLLDLHIGAGGKDKYVSHCAALQKWVFDAVNERRLKLRTPQFTRPVTPEVAAAQRHASKKQPYDHELTAEELTRNRAAARKARMRYFERKEQMEQGA